MKGNTLEQRVIEKLGEEVVLPSTVKKELKFCSDKLKRIKTIEEFDEIMADYKLLATELKRSTGLLRKDFDKIISDMKKEL